MVISGIVDQNGGSIAGEGFESRQIATGVYIVEFQEDLGQVAIPVATTFGSEWETYDKSISIVDFTDRYMICVTSNPNQRASCGFSFLVN